MDLNSLNEQPRKVLIKVAGELVEVNPTDNVKETLRRILSGKGIDSFTILVNGSEITNTNDLPETFAGAESFEIQRYVKPGC